jgi:hypothetical protein
MTMLAVFPARSDEVAGPVPSNGQCAVAVDEQWTRQEQFVWSHVCVGQVADFNADPEFGGDLDLKRPEGLPDNRVLRPAFVEMILLADKYRRSLTRNGVHIVGARFIALLDLSRAELAHELWLDRSLLEKGADLSKVKSTRDIIIDRSRASDKLLLMDARIDGDLTIRRSDLSEVEAGSSHVGGDFNLDQSSFAHGLDLNSLQLAGDLNLSAAELRDASLAEARIGGSVVMSKAKSSGELTLSFSEIGGLVVIDQSRLTQLTAVGMHVHGLFVIAQTKVTGAVNMAAIQVVGNLAMNNQSEFADVELGNAHILSNMGMDGAKVHGKLDMSNLQLDGGLDLSGGAEFASVGMNYAHLGSFVALVGSKVRDELNMFMARIDGDLDGAKAEFGKVNLTKLRLLGDLNLQGAKVSGPLRMQALQVAGALQLNDNAEFTDIDLLDARVGGLLNLRQSKVAGMLDLESIEVRGDLFLGNGAEFSGPVKLIFSNVGELELANGTFHSDVDITGAVIRSDLLLGPPSTVDGAALILHNAKANTVQDSSDTRPAKLDLTGFTYRSLGGVHPDEGYRRSDRPVEWYRNWLSRQPYSPQPYVQLAAVLRDEGRPDVADDILYAGRQRERQQVAWLQRIWLTALDWFVGYGYHVERALYWVVGFILTGVIVLRVSGEGRRHSMPYGLAYSFDLLLPIIKLREMHYSIELNGWPRYYFYLHKIMGYVLASFLIVGLSSMVK